jgi:hypothetical protein
MEMCASSPIMNAMPTLESLREALSAAGVAYADTAAVQLLADIGRFGMSKFRLGRKFPTELGTVVEYTFGKNAYSIENANPKRAPQFMPSDHGGTQLNSENILVFLRASELARKLAPTIWLQPSDDLRGKITSSSQHLDTLNEFWWLSRWNGSFEATPNFKMHSDSDLDVDWRLTWNFGLNTFLSVNLEVKRRMDVLRTGGESLIPQDIFEAGFIKEGRGKFRPSQPDEINVLGITLIGEIDHEVQQQTEIWLQTRADVDAIILFSRFSSRNPALAFHVHRKNELLSQVLNRQLDDKDNCLHSLIVRPLPCTISQMRFLP